VAFLTGPNVPLSSAMSQLARSAQAEPFGPWEGTGGPTDPIQAALCQLAGLMTRFMGIIESLIRMRENQPEQKDDFMQGWGEPGGDIEER
jgi:hypothetical protein